MFSIRSSAALARASDRPLDPPLRKLLVLRRDQLLENTDCDLGELVHLIVVCRGDTLATVEAGGGTPLATRQVDGSQLGDRCFTHNFEFVQRHPSGLIKAVLIVSADGFGVVLFVFDVIVVDPQLLRLLGV